MSADPQPPLIHSLTAQTLSCPSDTVRATAAHGAPRVLGPWDQHNGATLAVMAAGGRDAARAEGEGKAGRGFRTVRQPPQLGGELQRKGPFVLAQAAVPKAWGSAEVSAAPAEGRRQALDSPRAEETRRGLRTGRTWRCTWTEEEAPGKRGPGRLVRAEGTWVSASTPRGWRGI